MISWTSSKLKLLLCEKLWYYEQKRLPSSWGKIFANRIPNKGCMKNFQSSPLEKQQIQLEIDKRHEEKFTKEDGK